MPTSNNDPETITAQQTEDLKETTSSLKNKIEELNQNNLSAEEKEKKEKEAGILAEKVKQQIKEIEQNNAIKESETIKAIEEARNILNVYNQLENLKGGIKPKTGEETTTPPTTGAGVTTQESETNEPEQEKKGFFSKAGEWIGEKWGSAKEWIGGQREKAKENPGKYILAASGISLCILAMKKGIDRISGKKEEKKKENETQQAEQTAQSDQQTAETTQTTQSNPEKNEAEQKKSFWDGKVGKVIKGIGTTILVGTGAYYVAHGLYTKNRGLNDLFDREKGKKLEFDTALEYCKGAISNQDNKEGMSYGLDLKFHEDTSEIEAYGERIKIDKNKRKIIGTGLGEVEFNKYEHMINAAIVIAYLKKNYSGKCTNNCPFYPTSSFQGDIDVNTYDGRQEATDGTGTAGRIAGISAGCIGGILTGIRAGLRPTLAVTTILCGAGYFIGSQIDHDNIMNDHMPELDNENGKKRLCAYLNSMACREYKNQTSDEITESPIKNEIIEVIEEIQRTNQELAERGGRRQLDAIQDPDNQNKYTIKAYNRDFSAEITGEEGNRKIKILGISGGNPEIKTDTEDSGLTNIELPLKEGLYMSCFLGFLLDNFTHKGVEYPWFQYTSRGLGINEGIYFNNASTVSLDYDRRVLSKDKFEKRMPTLFQESTRTKFLKFLNDGITGTNNISIRKK